MAACESGAHGLSAIRISPSEELANLYVLAGHFIASGTGFAALAIMHAWTAPPVLSTHHLTLLRVWTSVLAMLFTAAAILVLRASHPPAGSTALLVSLGSFRTLNDALTVVVGVIIVGVLGEALRFWRLRRQPRGHAKTVVADAAAIS